MLIPFGEILQKYKIEPKGIIHVGSHFCEEHNDYVSYGIKEFVYIEPCANAYKEMMKMMIVDFNVAKGGAKVLKGIPCIWIKENNIELINCACGSEEKEMVMYVSNDNEGQSNSLLEPHLHLEQHKEVVFDEAEAVKVKLLDNIIENKELFSILAMDCQGYEGEVLKGATETIKHIDVVYTEVNRGSTYKDNMLIEGIDELLHEFERVETYWPSPNWTWGDAVYIRKPFL